MILRKKEIKMKTERELFEAWVKKEHTHIFNGAEQGDNRFKMDIDFMYMAWQASAQREGYRIVPVEPSEDMIMVGCMEHGGYDVIDSKSIYKAMIGAVP